MSTRKFVSIIVSALVVFFLIVSSVGLALADDSVRSVAAVVTGYKTSSFGNLEIEVVDAEGNIWAYYADKAHIGDLVILTVFDFEELSYEDDEIVDVVTIGRLSNHEMVQWLCR